MAKKTGLSHLGEGDHLGSHIDRVGNGYIVRLSSESRGKRGDDSPVGGGSYTSKTLVALDEPTALRIASGHFANPLKMKGKKSAKKKGVIKISMSKR